MKTNLLLFLCVIAFIGCSDKLYRKTIKGHYKILDIAQLTNESSDSSLVTGVLIDEHTRSPVPYGWIKIEGTIIGKLADSLGNYSLKIYPGEYKFVAKSGSNTELTTKKIKIERNKKVRIDFYLGTNIIE